MYASNLTQTGANNRNVDGLHAHNLLAGANPEQTNNRRHKGSPGATALICNGRVHGDDGEPVAAAGTVRRIRRATVPTGAAVAVLFASASVAQVADANAAVVLLN
jgi:hypothetical protein